MFFFDVKNTPIFLCRFAKHLFSLADLCCARVVVLRYSSARYSQVFDHGDRGAQSTHLQRNSIPIALLLPQTQQSVDVEASLDDEVVLTSAYVPMLAGPHI